MKIYKGQTRIVVVIGIFAIKIARIEPIRAIKSLLLFIKRHIKDPEKYSIWRFWIWDHRVYFTPVWHLLRGVMANYWEARLYRETKSAFLIPTYISLFGFANIQKAGPKLPIESVDCWCQIVEMTSMDEAFCDSHLFADPKNFCWVDGHLKIVDYGNKDSHDFLRKYGDKLYSEFRLDYSWEEEKKKRSAK